MSKSTYVTSRREYSLVFFDPGSPNSPKIFVASNVSSRFLPSGAISNAARSTFTGHVNCTSDRPSSTSCAKYTGPLCRVIDSFLSIPKSCRDVVNTADQRPRMNPLRAGAPSSGAGAGGWVSTRGQLHPRDGGGAAGMAAARSRAPYLPRSPPSSTSSAAAQTDAIDPSTASTPNAQLRFQASLQRELRDAKEELVRAQLENVALASRLRESSSPGASSRRGAESDVTCGTIAGMLSEEDADERRRELLEAIRDERDARGRVEERARALEAELSAKDDKLRAATEMMHEMREALVEAYDGTAHGAGRDAGPAGTTTRGGKSGADDDDDAAAATATAATATAVSPGDMAAGAVKGVVSLVGVLVGTAGFELVWPLVLAALWLRYQLWSAS